MRPSFKCLLSRRITVPAAAIQRFNVRPDTAADDEPIAEDFETLLVDPLTSDVFLVEKRRDTSPSDEAGIFLLASTATSDQDLVLPKVGSLPFNLFTGGDVSPDGQRILLRQANNIVGLSWTRDPDQSVADALTAGEPCRLALAVEPQGESLALAADGQSFFTLSEGVGQFLYESFLPDEEGWRKAKSQNSSSGIHSKWYFLLLTLFLALISH